tara:strand:- start:175 stop:438 length:264 start_codon:yes stop_codon:yes gene_type:complete
MPMSYEKVKRFYLFAEEKAPGARSPDYKNGKVVFEVGLEPGRYSVAGWRYEDTGNISLEIQRVTEDIPGGAPAPAAAPVDTVGGFDD